MLVVFVERIVPRKKERKRRRDAMVNQEVEVPMALTKCQLGVEQSAIKAFAFSLEKQNPFFPRFEQHSRSTKPFNMFKLCILSVLLTVVCGAPAATPGAILAAPAAAIAAVPAPIVTASSSQVVARNYNTLAAAPLVAAPIAYSYAATPLAAYSTHAVAPAAYAAYSAPVLL